MRDIFQHTRYVFFIFFWDVSFYIYSVVNPFAILPFGARHVFESAWSLFLFILNIIISFLSLINSTCNDLYRNLNAASLLNLYHRCLDHISQTYRSIVVVRPGASAQYEIINYEAMTFSIGTFQCWIFKASIKRHKEQN